MLKRVPAVIWELCKKGLRSKRYAQFFSVRSAILLCTLLVSAPYSPHGFAQSTDSCLSARLADALTICQALISNGSRDVNVYWTLTSAQYQDGQQALANRTLAQALRVHPGNSKLETLKQIISSDSAEQKRIAQSSKLNQNSIDKGALKITCLTKSGDLAISACTRRLELTNEDGDRIRARLSKLQKAKPRTRFGSAPTRPTVQTPVVVAPSPVIIIPPIQDSLPQPSTGQLTLDERKAAYKKLVANVQSRLNNFGFNAGLADGVPGNNTRKALAAFYTAIQAPVKKSITNLTLNDLSIAQIQLDKAQDLLIESQLALSKGDVKIANTKLVTAKRTSALLKIPANLQRFIQANLGGTQQPVTTPTPPQNSPVSSLNSSATPQQFENLMSQIKILQGQIQRKQSDQENRLSTLRDAL